jgi:hypothetical protein
LSKDKKEEHLEDKDDAFTFVQTRAFVQAYARLYPGSRSAHDGMATPAFSMAFIGPMLWSRYEAAGGALGMTTHLGGPANDDVVIVSDEAVIAGLLDGRLTPVAARDLGLMRLYGTPERVQGLTSWLDRLPVQSRADPIKAEQ